MKNLEKQVLALKEAYCEADGMFEEEEVLEVIGYGPGQITPEDLMDNGFNLLEYAYLGHPETFLSALDSGLWKPESVPSLLDKIFLEVEADNSWIEWLGQVADCVLNTFAFLGGEKLQPYVKKLEDLSFVVTIDSESKYVVRDWLDHGRYQISEGQDLHPDVVSVVAYRLKNNGLEWYEGICSDDRYIHDEESIRSDLKMMSKQVLESMLEAGEI